MVSQKKLDPLNVVPYSYVSTIYPHMESVSLKILFVVATVAVVGLERTYYYQRILYME